MTTKLALVLVLALVGCSGYPRVVPTYGAGDPQIEADEDAKQRAFQAKERRLHCDPLMRSNAETEPRPECIEDAGAR